MSRPTRYRQQEIQHLGRRVRCSTDVGVLDEAWSNLLDLVARIFRRYDTQESSDWIRVRIEATLTAAERIRQYQLQREARQFQRPRHVVPFSIVSGPMASVASGDRPHSSYTRSFHR